MPNPVDKSYILILTSTTDIYTGNRIKVGMEGKAVPIPDL